MIITESLQDAFDNEESILQHFYLDWRDGYNWNYILRESSKDDIFINTESLYIWAEFDIKKKIFCISSCEDYTFYNPIYINTPIIVNSKHDDILDALESICKDRNGSYNGGKK